MVTDMAQFYAHLPHLDVEVSMGQGFLSHLEMCR
jgi:hypothetical protein